jgi:hypothetical protein
LPSFSLPLSIASKIVLTIASSAALFHQITSQLWKKRSRARDESPKDESQSGNKGTVEASNPKQTGSFTRRSRASEDTGSSEVPFFRRIHDILRPMILPKQVFCAKNRDFCAF